MTALHFHWELEPGRDLSCFGNLAVEATGGSAAFLLVFSTWGKPKQEWKLFQNVLYPIATGIFDAAEAHAPRQGAE